METLEKDLIRQVRDCFFDVIDEDTEMVDSQLFLNHTLFIFLKMLQVESVAYYTYDEWRQQFNFVESINGLTEYPSIIQEEDLKNLLESKGVVRKPFPAQMLEDFDLLAGIYKDKRLSGFLGFINKHGSRMNSITDAGFRSIGNEYGAVIEKFQSLAKTVSEKNKYKRLFNVTKIFHSSMNTDILLDEIIGSIQEIYPFFTYYLLLSQDNHHNPDLPVKDLEYDSENIGAMQAYVTGTIQFEASSLPQHSILYAPLKGKQGVYGVLQVTAPNTLTFPQNEIDFIALFAQTAGSAIENAQLYEQSKKIIAALQLINETSHCLNSNLRLTETIHYMTERITQSFDAQEVGFYLYSTYQDTAKILPGSTEFFFTKIAMIYIDDIKEKVQTEKDSLFIGDLRIQKMDNSINYRSILAVPMDLGDHLKGIAIVMHQEPYFFSFEKFKLLQALIHHSTLAFTNSMLREELERMIVTDHLTKLHSRNYLDEQIQLSMREDDKGTFILIDIDNFKKINDTYGHQVGDEVLIQVASLIKNNIRGADIGARWGGEELVIYSPKVSLDAGVSIANRLVKKVDECTNPHVTISCGVSFWDKEQTDSFKFLFKRADEALYLAKETGKNKVVTQEETTTAS